MSSHLADTQSEPHSRRWTLNDLEGSILQTVAYADVFDYPLTSDEVHRYLLGVRTSLSLVRDALGNGRIVDRHLSRCQDYFTLPGREAIVETRLRRAQVATRMWPKAIRYGLSIASLPFVRMVAVTGTLAVDNADSDADIDYMIVTAPRRLWLARLFSIIFVHIGSLERLTICPNYVISTDALEQFDRTLFTAHELAQMVPIYGFDVYQKLIHVNGWARGFLPNAFEGQRERGRAGRPLALRTLKRGLEFALGGRLGDTWERWERRTKIRRLSEQADDCGSGAAAFTSQLCKGHLEDHGRQIASAYAQRLELVGVGIDRAEMPYQDSRGDAGGHEDATRADPSSNPP